MIVRLIKNYDGELLLLCSNGSINKPTGTMLYNLLKNFENADTFHGDDGQWNTEMSEMALIDGVTIAVVTDEKKLIINDFSPFEDLVKGSIIRFISVEEYANKHDKSPEIVKVYLRQKRISGAQKIGRSWAIPEDAPYPVAPEYQREASPFVGRPPKKRD